MSTSSPAVQGKSAAAIPSSGFPVILVVAGALAVLLWFLFTQAASLDRSIIGTSGFASFAKSRGLNIRILSTRTKIDAQQIGLRILPLYTPRYGARARPTGGKENENEEVLRPISSYVVGGKIKAIPTLLVLPKWRSGAVTLERLHPKLLVGLRSAQFAPGSRIKRGGAGFSRFILQPGVAARTPGFKTLAGVTANLFLAQTMILTGGEKSRCKPVLAAGEDVLLAQCQWRNSGVGYWVLSDPDLINNHGAGVDENIETALAIIGQLAGDKQIILDHTNVFFSTDRESRESRADKRKRTLGDLSRFLAFPFAHIWIAFAMLAFFAVWHCGRRAGPVDDGEAENAVHASKATAIEANINILRAAGNNQALAKRHMEQRMERLAADIIGSGCRGGKTGREHLVDIVERRSASLGHQLRSIVETLDGEAAEGRQIFAQLNRFEQLIDEVKDAFGRTPGTRHKNPRGSR